MSKLDTIKTVTAYSYLRWSSAIQTKGDSFKRQLEKTRAVCREKGWTLDESIKPDSGVSAYKGDNLRKGFLGNFIAKVDAGEISTPCILCVENWDRITRQKLSRAQELLQDLLKKGVSIYTANTGKLYDRSCLDDPMALFQFLLEAQSAHIYSENLSGRLKASWKRKKEAARNEGKLLTRRLPGWLLYDEKSKAIVIDDSKAATVRTIFAMYLKGHGVDTIAKTLNEKDTPTFSRRSKESGWAQSTIRRILRSVSVYGSYQPTCYEGIDRINDGSEVESYYPAILPKKTYFEAKQSLEGRRGIRGPKRTLMNLFTGLVNCAHCGCPMVIKAGAATQDKKKKAWIALVCRNALRGKGCFYKTFLLRYFENAVVTVLLQNILQHLYPSRKPEEYEKLVTDLQHVETQLANAKSDRDTLERPSPSLHQYIDLKVEQVSKIKAQIEAMPPNDEYIYPYDKITRFQIEPLKKDIDSRLKVRALLPSIVQEIVLDADKKLATLYFRFTNPEKQEKFTRQLAKVEKKDGSIAALQWAKENARELHFSVMLAWPTIFEEKDDDGHLFFFKDDEACSYEDGILWK